MTITTRRALWLAAALVLPCATHAQVRASELGSVSQTVDGTVITVEYSRPRLRGRTGIFGSRAVHWGETWTPGANYATTLDVSRDVSIDGHPLKKGKYSVWMVVREAGPWTFVLEPNAKLFHMSPPDSSAAQVRFPVQPMKTAITDVLTWSFPELRATGATLAMQWDTVRVAVDVAVTPSLSVTMPEGDARAYLGSYTTVRQDSSSHVARMVVLYEQGTLKAEFVPADPYFKRFALIRTGKDTFAPGIYDDKGQIYEVLRPDVTFTFARKGDRMTVESRSSDDALWWAGERKQE